MKGFLFSIYILLDMNICALSLICDVASERRHKSGEVKFEFEVFFNKSVHD